MNRQDIQALRLKMGLSRNQFAYRLGTTERTVFRWEEEGRKPSPMALKLLSMLAEEVFGGGAKNLRGSR